MGGCAAGGPQNAGVRSCLIRQPRAAPIPAAVARITGISEEDLRHAVSAEAAWKELISAAQYAAAQNRSGACPLVIHFARFEIPFLRRLHEIGSPGTPFPFRVICTHAIARRLLPDLPRRGIRALAGYFDHAVPELRRSADHALATLAIWKCLLALLQSRCGVDTLQGLEDWLAVTPLPGKVRRTYPMDCEDRRALPEQPGVYRMRRANGDILYVGKAKSLRQRVNSYFRGSAAHAEHILEMLTQARALDFAATASALEAAVLESDEIKRHCPPYNIALRPGKRKRSSRSGRTGYSNKAKKKTVLRLGP
ncbi:MAG: hypothetical protein C4519_05935 [Desulfobacteraceae bacterium]|nr:MAG: hypothetical protein C4519_05935 [Desulfobacteraceae bacterium]